MGFGRTFVVVGLDRSSDCSWHADEDLHCTNILTLRQEPHCLTGEETLLSTRRQLHDEGTLASQGEGVSSTLTFPPRHSARKYLANRKSRRLTPECLCRPSIALSTGAQSPGTLEANALVNGSGQVLLCLPSVELRWEF